MAHRKKHENNIQTILAPCAPDDIAGIVVGDAGAPTDPDSLGAVDQDHRKDGAIPRGASGFRCHEMSETWGNSARCQGTIVVQWTGLLPPSMTGRDPWRSGACCIHSMLQQASSTVKSKQIWYQRSWMPLKLKQSCFVLVQNPLKPTLECIEVLCWIFNPQIIIPFGGLWIWGE